MSAISDAEDSFVGAVTSAVRSAADTLVAAVTVEIQSEDQAALDAAETITANLQTVLDSTAAQLTASQAAEATDKATIATLQAQLAALQGPVSPVAEFQTLAWHDTFTTLDPKRWTVTPYGATRKNEKSVSDPANVTTGPNGLSIRGQRLTTPVNGMSYSSGYVTGKGLLKPGCYVESEVRFPCAPGKSAGLWPALWHRSALTSLEVDNPEVWGTPSLVDASKSDAPGGRFAFNVYPDTNSSAVKIGGWMADPGSLDLTVWHKIGLLYGVDGSVTPYLDGKPQTIKVGKGVGKSTVTPADLAALKPVAGDSLDIRIQLQIGGNTYGQPTAATDFTQSFDVRSVTVWTK